LPADIGTTARIASIDTTVVTAHAKSGLRVRGARVVHDTSSFVVVRVVTDEGVEGYGEISATAAWSGEDHVTARHFIHDLLGPRLVGQPLASIAQHGIEMDRVLRGNWFTKAGVDTALWDALGHTVGCSVAELLGGPYRREVATKVSLSGDGDDLREGYATAASLGFGAFKVKVGRDPEADVARVRLARELVGPEALLGVDANGGWTRDVAMSVVPRLAVFEIEFVEQPVAADDLEGMRDVRKLGIPVVADESVYSNADVERVIRSGAADIVSIYVGKSSGLQRAVTAAATAARLGAGVVIGSNGEMDLGAAAQLHVACACEELGTIPCGIIGHHFYEDDSSLEEPLSLSGSAAQLPNGPGLGVRPSERVRSGFDS
jgi:L-alanine-DL-glutamate epimerase-like enolase superfamily enzyme